MSKKILLGIAVLFFGLSGGLVAAGTEQARRQALAESGSGGKAVFKTVMRAAKRYGDTRVFANLARRVGLQYPLNNYNGKKKIKSKKMKRYLDKIPQGQKITVLAPIGGALAPLVHKLRAAQEGTDKAASKAVLQEVETVLLSHIIKGELLKDALKGEVETLSGTKIKAENLQFYKADIKAKNGVFHIIKRLATAQPEASESAIATAGAKKEAAKEEPAAAKPAEKPAEQTAQQPSTASQAEASPATATPSSSGEVAAGNAVQPTQAATETSSSSATQAATAAAS